MCSIFTDDCHLLILQYRLEETEFFLITFQTTHTQTYIYIYTYVYIPMDMCWDIYVYLSIYLSIYVIRIAETLIWYKVHIA